MKRQRGRTQQQRESYLPPTPQFSTTTTHRDSDASFTSAQINQPFNKTGAIHWINEYLTSHNFGFTLSLKSLPSSDDLKDLLRFLLSQLHFPVHKLEDDFLSVLKSLNCPHKINKSVLSTPAAPHSFPRILPVILWLVHLAHFTSPPPDHPPRYSPFFGFYLIHLLSCVASPFHASSLCPTSTNLEPFWKGGQKRPISC